ncbi:sigma-70 family RNA polymerase sigma factor [Streptomyces sp. CMB-StM0423]|uniref:sigma-70 family RNA polymerase sigma factor n=1 Tax=Streptomyces sp. CMB-StM0423 TaxID=2059884 RepID=UPI000C7052B4|nr:sigma-70 family RNA polymerase sigma factor [Streptomyces sp. CMB-StM0423]AUH41574.1 sigma-70 family RNA polymerase sigma factor [Streptomyces sp. CMB-StM0423]
MTSSPDPEPARQPPPPRPPEQYEPYLDGLFTYCMSVLCDHDDAVAALGDVLAIAERQPRRRPATPAEWRPWLYSLARWACVRRLDQKPGQRAAQRALPRPGQRRPAAAAEEKRSAGAAGAGAVPGAASGAEAAAEAVSAATSATAPEATAEAAPEAAARLRRRELAALAWPEAAGTTPEQREALELAVRHRLPAEEVATVLGQHPDAARVLLSTAAAEVERTRAALAVVDQHGCPAIARLAGDSRLFLSAALSRELVRHVDDCAECRRAAERAGAGWAWPGTLRAARPDGPLPVLEAPRAAAYAAMLLAQRTRFVHAPRFDRRGYPRDPRHRAARRGRLRSRAVTSTVVATVIAAPVLALWAANRGAPAPGEAQSGWPPPSADAEEPESLDGRPVEKAGSAHDDSGPGSRDGNHPDVSVEVVDRGRPTPGRPGMGPGRLTVAAWPAGETTYLRLRASGGAPVDWRVGTDAGWLRFSATYGTLRPGEAATVAVGVAEASEPRTGWQARVYVSPGGAAILITGTGNGRPGPGGGAPGPSRPPAQHPPDSPSPPDPSDPGPSPSDPAPSPSEPDPSPSDPGPSPSDPDPSPSDPDPTPTASDTDPSAPDSSPAQAPARAG